MLLPASMVLVAVSCGAGHGSTTDDREIAIYSAVIRAVVTQPAGQTTTTRPHLSVFVVPADERTPISLEVQAGIVDALHSYVTVRFDDKRSEAIDIHSTDKVVHQNGVLLALGRIPAGRDDVTVEVERYERAGVDRTFRVRLHRTGSTWAVTSVS
jgi:hypothetical protein